MKKLKQIKPHILILAAGILLYAAISTFSFARAFATGYISLGDMSDIATLQNKFDDYGQHFKNIYRGIDFNYTKAATGEMNSTQVIFGKEDWLFYKGEVTSVEDYEGTNSYSSEELDQMLESAMDVQSSLESRGIKFALLVPPNKERVYYEYMPENYKHAEMSRTDKLMDYLAENGVNAISPMDRIMDAKSDYQVYYYADTHWNQLGAYIGAQCVLESWGIDMPDLDDREINERPVSQSGRDIDDLANMVGIKHAYRQLEKEYSIKDNVEVDWDNFDRIRNDDAANNAVLLIIGDSFRTAMAPTLATEFQTVYIVHRDDYENGMLDNIDPDYVIIEYVERASGGIAGIREFLQ